MALKKEQNEFNYSERIGVNRGGGFEFAARVAGQTANALDNLTSQYADQALQDLKVFGKKVGEDAAENAQFSKKEITYTDPITKETKTQYINGPIPTFKATTKTMAEAYEKEIYNKYTKEVQSNIDTIILEERRNVIKSIRENKGGTPDDFDAVVKARVTPILENLEPKFRQVIETYTEDTRQGHWYQVADEKDRQDIKINNLNYDTNISNLSEEVETAYIGGDPTSIAVKEKEIKDYIETSKARGIDKAVTQGDQLLKTLEDSKSFYKLLSDLSIKDLDAASGSKLKNSIDDFRKVELVLRNGAGSATLSTGQVITADQLRQDSNFNEKVLENARIRVTGIISNLNSLYTENSKGFKNAQFVGNNLKSASSGTTPYWGNSSAKEKREAVDSPDSQTLLLNSFKKLDPSIAEVDDSTILSSVGYAKFLIRTQGTLNTFWYNKINNAFESYNQADIQDLNANSLLSGITTGVMTFKRDGMVSTMEVNNVRMLDFNATTQGKMLMLQQVLTYNPNLEEAITKVKNHYDKFEQEGGQSLSQAISMASGKKYKVSDIDMQIAQHMEDKLDKKFFGDALYSSQLFNQVKRDVHTMIVDGGLPLRNLSDVNKLVESSMAYVLSGQTGYGYSKYTFSNFINQKLDSGEYGSQQHFVLHPAEQYYGLPLEAEDQKGSWMTNSIMTKVKESEEYDKFIKNFREKDVQFGNNIKLQSAGYEVPPKYYIVYVDNDGKPDILQDKNGFPMIYDPNPEFVKLRTEQHDSDDWKIHLEELKSNRETEMKRLEDMSTGTQRRKERRDNPPKIEFKKVNMGLDYLDVDETDLLGTEEERKPKVTGGGTKARYERRKQNK